MFYPKWLDINVTMMSRLIHVGLLVSLSLSLFKGSSLWLSSVCLCDFDHKLKEYCTVKV